MVPNCPIQTTPSLWGNNGPQLYNTDYNLCNWANIFRRLFSKRCTFGSKGGTKSLVRWYQTKFAKTAPERLKVCHTYLAYKMPKKNLCLVIFFIHIIQLSIFSNEYYGKYSLLKRAIWIMWIKDITKHKFF